MKVSGFGPLQGLTTLMPQDYINYLKMVSARNKRTYYPQFHVTISAKGKSTGKEALTEIATNWMKEMGYKDQPYLIIFHKDTANNHVHIVSTRINKEGKKINSGFEKMRAIQNMNKLMKLDALETARMDLQKVLAFSFSTKAQFMLLLEAKGYVLKDSGGKMDLIKFGKKLLSVEFQDVKDRIAGAVIDSKRAVQIAAIIHKYKKEYSCELRSVAIPLPGGFEKAGVGFSSDLCEVLQEKIGLQFLFHGQPGMAPYGYSIIDHAQGIVFKGGEVMDKEVLLAEQRSASEVNIGLDAVDELDQLNSKIEAEIKSGIRYAEDPADMSNPSSDHQFSSSTAQPFHESGTQPISSEQSFEPFQQPIQISISDDIDDEAIHGRNRHRKRQARTNTR